jgi:hypothetical protein
MRLGINQRETGELMLRNKKLASVLVGGALAASVLGVASPAQAGTGDCGRGYACMWQDTSYSGAYYKIQYNISFNLNTFNNTTSSIMNNGYSGNLSKAYFYDASNYTGTFRRIYDPASGKQYIDPYLGNGVEEDTRAFNDVTSSASFGN